MTVLTCAVVSVTALTPPALAAVFIIPAIAGGAAISAATISGALSEKTFTTFSKMVEAPEIISSALEAAQGALISTGTGCPSSTIFVGTAAVTATQILIWVGWPTPIAAVWGTVSALMLHQIPMLLIVNSFRDLVLSTPATMSGVIFTPLIGGSIAYYATMGGNLILQNISLANIEI